MKVPFYILMSLVAAPYAHAQPLFWSGPAAGGYGPFSMAGWMYAAMVQVATQAEKDANGGIPTNYGTESNAFGGYNVTYTGDGKNQITCHSQFVNSPTGQWICQFNNNQLMDGPLTERLVNHFLTREPHPQTINASNGKFIISGMPGQIQFVFKYNNGRVEGIVCGYRLSQTGVVNWAACSVK